MENIKIKVKENDKNIRLDKFLSNKLQDLSRSYLQKLLKKNYIKVNHEKVKKSYKISVGDDILVKIPPPEKTDIKPKKMDLDIIYEDQNIIVINKPAGLVVHPAPGNWNNTLVNGLLAYTDDLSGISGEKRPGIVHRLDKETSGVLVVAKDDQSHKNLSEQFKQRKVEKIYKTVVKGIVPHKSGKIKAPIGRDPDNRKKMAVTKKNSKKAITRFKLLEKQNNYSLLQILLKTGRTHQIRVHMSYYGYPVVGDEKYGNNKEKLSSQLLHAYKLGLFHPVREEWIVFKAPLPLEFKNFIQKNK